MTKTYDPDQVQMEFYGSDYGSDYVPPKKPDQTPKCEQTVKYVTADCLSLETDYEATVVGLKWMSEKNCFMVRIEAVVPDKGSVKLVDFVGPKLTNEQYLAKHNAYADLFGLVVARPKPNMVLTPFSLYKTLIARYNAQKPNYVHRMRIRPNKTSGNYVWFDIVSVKKVRKE